MKIKPHAIILIFTAALASGCGQAPAVTAVKKQHAEFIGAKPQASNIVGTYILNDQTVLPGGISALGGRQCEISVRTDGSFWVTNYPQNVGGSFSSFHSTTGTWQLASIGTSHGYGSDPKQCWGFRFYGAANKIEATAFTGSEQSYGLLTILGDPDSNLTLRFKKKVDPTRRESE